MVGSTAEEFKSKSNRDVLVKKNYKLLDKEF